MTENVKDFAPLLRRAKERGERTAALLFASSRTFPRSRRKPGLLIDALDAWLHAAESTESADVPIEDWLSPPDTPPSWGRAENR